MSKKDLKPSESEPLGAPDWHGNPADALQKVREYVVKKARRTVDWYYTGKRTKKEASVSVSPGLHVVRASGKLGTKDVQAEKSVTVGAGEIKKVDLMLA